MPYEGNPTYTKRSLLIALLEPWCDPCFEGSEWGEWITALYDAIQRGMFCGSENLIDTMINEIFEEFAAAGDNGIFADYWYEDQITRAKKALPDTVEMFRKSHTTYPAEQRAISEVLDSLPDWIKPDPEWVDVPLEGIDG